MKIVLACGGTGGHIFPAFSVAEELKKRYPNVKIIYVCGKKDIENEIFKIIVDEKIVSIESAPARMALSLSGFHFLLKLKVKPILLFYL
jgi:UDP-N-acetylglucosamine--N-acetylmuramyl-(pentapeptide) pyrophosphoryl-undecaprenol N-acetylglucosamine transferase